MGFTDNKISVIEQLDYTSKASIIVLQETHCITADKLVIPNFSLAGSILSRNHGLATVTGKFACNNSLLNRKQTC